MNNCEHSLIGQTVLVTRAVPLPGCSDSLVDLLKKAGADVLACPVIKLSMAKEIEPAEQAIGDLNRYGALVFASSNGVQFFSQLIDRFAVSPAMVSDALEVVAIGNGTEATLLDLGYDSISKPESASSQSLAEWLCQQGKPPYLIVRADRGSNVLAIGLEQQGKRFREIVVYESSDVQEVDSKFKDQLQAGEVDWVTLTSSAIAHSAIHLFGESLRTVKLITLSPQISEVVRQSGFEIAAEAKKANFNSLVDALKV